MELMDRSRSELLLKKHGIDILPLKPAKTISEALKVAERIGYPIAMKINSPDITHKTDVGGVILNIQNHDDMVDSWERMMSSVKKGAPKARVQGVVIQRMFPGNEARELIIGVKTDAQFGHMIAFGLGGIFVEVLKDISFRLIPITKHDASEMLGEIRGKKILEGFRGQKPIPHELLVEILLKVSKMVEKNPKIKEMDINPLLVDHKQAIAADFRFFV
ncbi:MAG: acetate--CoA ligase family protein [Candidatus Aenigmatarchaeota archaeon]